MNNVETHRSKPETIRTMFSTIAPRYDLANTVLSFGIHHLWRNALVRWSDAGPGQKVCDVATGTGDLALTFDRKIQPNGYVVGVDFVEAMVQHAQHKAFERNQRVPFQCGDAQALPFPDNYFDVVSISFGIRNVANPGLGITELTRILKPGGRLMVLEFGSQAPGLWGQLFNWYSRVILPRLGGLVTGQTQAYHYLQKSSAEFPGGKDFVALMHKSADFQDIQFRSLSGGIAYLYRGVKCW